MLDTPSVHPVLDGEVLWGRFGPPSPKAATKKRGTVDERGAAYIRQAPFMVMATASASGNCDASPKGGSPGFVLVADPGTLLIPDYPGNRLFDGLRNVSENPHVGLLFMIPGEDWTFRVNGRARVVDDAAVLERLRQHDPKGKQPQLAIEVRVDECFFHCPKSFVAADIWNPAKHHRFEELPPQFKA